MYAYLYLTLFYMWSASVGCVFNCRFVYPQVPPVLAQKIFTQIFSYINVQLFNRWAYLPNFGFLYVRKLVLHDYCLFCSLLLRRECCSFSNGEYVKAGLAELEMWCAKATAEVICLMCDSSFFSYMIQITKVSWLQYAASSWDEIRHIRQAVGFLVRCSILLSYMCIEFNTRLVYICVNCHAITCHIYCWIQ
jgi:hypothetical protein